MVEKQIGDTKFNANILEFDIKLINFYLFLVNLMFQRVCLKEMGKKKKKKKKERLRGKKLRKRRV